MNIKEEIVVAGDRYSGNFSIAAYDPKTKALLSRVAGNVIGLRANVNTGP